MGGLDQVDVVDGWAFATPAPLAAGTTRVEIEVVPLSRSVPRNFQPACDGALSEARIEYQPGDDPAVQYVEPGLVDREIRWVWPYGFSARDRDGELEIVEPNGDVFATGGQTISVGGGLAEDGAFHVCVARWLPYRPGV